MGLEKVTKEIIAENFPNLARHKCMYMVKSRANPKKGNKLKKSIPRHMVIQLLKTTDNEKNLKGSQKKNTFTYREKLLEMTADFS